jgi:hypothetical protein
LLAGTPRRAGAGNAVATLLARDPVTHASLDDPWAIAALLKAPREAGDDNAVTTLAARAKNAGISGVLLNRHMAADTPWTRREPDGTASDPWSWQLICPRYDPARPT